jgi:hypothetical protein
VLITSTEEGRVSSSRAVKVKESSPVCFQIDPLSKTSDSSEWMSEKHLFPRDLIVRGRMESCNPVSLNAEGSMQSNPDLPEMRSTQAPWKIESMPPRAF